MQCKRIFPSFIIELDVLFFEKKGILHNRKNACITHELEIAQNITPDLLCSIVGFAFFVVLFWFTVWTAIRLFKLFS